VRIMSTETLEKWLMVGLTPALLMALLWTFYFVRPVWSGDVCDTCYINKSTGNRRHRVRDRPNLQQNCSDLFRVERIRTEQGKTGRNRTKGTVWQDGLNNVICIVCVLCSVSDVSAAFRAACKFYGTLLGGKADCLS